MRPVSREESTTFHAWQERLLRGFSEERTEAARSGFEACPEWGLEPLAAALDDSLLVVRLCAIGSLARLGSLSTEALVSALENPCFRTRMAAAEALGRVGDQRAVEPLSRCLRGCLVERSLLFKRRWLINLGYFVYPTASLLVFIYSGVKSATFAWILFLPCLAILMDFCSRGRRSRQIRCYATAIRRIAERETAEGARDLIPKLAAAATDVVMQSGEARQACREAAEALERSTSVLALPVIAAPPAAGASLPIPAGERLPAGENLPRIHEPDERGTRA